jgi:mono/diheme cytochrome c family protein
VSHLLGKHAQRLSGAAMLVLGLGSPLLGGCRGQTSTEPPIVPFRGMHEMPRYDVQEGAPYFDDGRAMRPPVEGTIPVEAEIDQAVADGVDATGAYVATIPQAAIDHFGPGSAGFQAMMERGQQRFGIYCAPCHGYAGDGQGMVSQRAQTLGVAFAAANLHDEAFLHMPDGRLYLTITNGVRTMPSYRGQIPVSDRWAIVAYVRALQLHQADPAAAAADDDHDHIPNFADACRTEAEDGDGFRDEDGCPDPDNDGDTVVDGADLCPNAAGTVEMNGCPPDQLPVAAVGSVAVPVPARSAP